MGMWMYEVVASGQSKQITVIAEHDKKINRLSLRNYTFSAFDVYCGKKLTPQSKWKFNHYDGSYYIDLQEKIVKHGKSIKLSVYNKSLDGQVFDAWFSHSVPSEEVIANNGGGWQVYELPGVAVVNQRAVDILNAPMRNNQVYRSLLKEDQTNPYMQHAIDLHAEYPIQKLDGYTFETKDKATKRYNNWTVPKHPIKFIGSGGFGMMTQEEKEDVANLQEETKHIDKQSTTKTAASIKKTITDAITKAFGQYIKAPKQR